MCVGMNPPHISREELVHLRQSSVLLIVNVCLVNRHKSLQSFRYHVQFMDILIVYKEGEGEFG